MCFSSRGEKGTNLPRNTLVIVSVKCVYRDKCGFAAAETNNSRYYCWFSLCLTLGENWEMAPKEK